MVHKKSDGTGLRTYHYFYDAAGNPTKIELNASNYWEFGYDNVYQLTSESRVGSNPYSAITYTYDPVGKRSSKVQGGQTTTYTYNDMNQMLTAGSATFEYDANGNTARKTEGANVTNYTWDYENKLTKIDNPSGDDYVYEYEGDGMRVRGGHDSGGGTVWDTRFYYDTGAPLYSYLFEADDAQNMQVAYTTDHWNFTYDKSGGRPTGAEGGAHAEASVSRRGLTLWAVPARVGD